MSDANPEGLAASQQVLSTSGGRRDAPRVLIGSLVDHLEAKVFVDLHHDRAAMHTNKVSLNCQKKSPHVLAKSNCECSSAKATM